MTMSQIADHGILSLHVEIFSEASSFAFEGLLWLSVHEFEDKSLTSGVTSLRIALLSRRVPGHEPCGGTLRHGNPVP